MGLTFAMMTGFAQTSASDYIVKTKGVKKIVAEAATSPEAVAGAENEEVTEPLDFVGKYFKYYSLCDWRVGMRFMVLPDKYDLIVKTFTDAKEHKEVSSLPLRHHIMTYKGHDEADGHARINFHDETNNKDYYYEIPRGSFEDYCYGKLGVPTLAFLGDVDVARDNLVGKTLITRATVYRVDTDNESDGYQEVRVPLNKEVKVTAVGVGTRSFPVKIIVEDDKGNEFYQNVAISKTNSGMRDDEFVQDAARNDFYGSFSVPDDIMTVSKNITDYLGKIVHTKFVTPMITRGDGRERTVRVPKMTSFIIDNISALRNEKYATLTLTEVESRRAYFKEISFEFNKAVLNNPERLAEYFGYLFALGEGVDRETTQAARAAIRAGRVTSGMTEDEVILAMGEEPDNKENADSGRYLWNYKRSSGKLTIVFGRNGIVEHYITPDENRKLEAQKNKQTVYRSSRPR